ncbi:MAG: ATP-binding cassette domain-containing protein [Chloroflexi bacterium]|nr:ATP-binding cassette domain-containing protein [Chloroflexota bacterium]
MKQTLAPAPAPEAAIQLQKVVKTFKNAAGEFHVLKGIDLTLQRGEFVAIVGKSGSGKSTLLNMITGIDHPTGGQVVINGINIYEMNESQRALWRGRNLGIVFQFFQLLPMLTLLENVMLPMDYVGLYDFDERPKRAMELLRMVGLETQAGKLPAAVSTGQQQSAAIARALANDPPVIAADEPTGNLDSRSAEAIINLFDHLVRSGKTIAMVTHDPSLTERTSRTIIITDGELVDETVAHCLPLLAHRQMLEATRHLERFTYQPGSTILPQGQHVDYFFMIERGVVEVVLCPVPSRKRFGMIYEIRDDMREPGLPRPMREPGLPRPVQEPGLPRGQKQEDTRVARLGPGQFFGEIELVQGGQSIACIRAAPDGPVDLSALHREPFVKLLGDSPLTEEMIGRIVQRRLEENRTADRRRRK